MPLFYWDKIRFKNRYDLYLDKLPVGELRHHLFGGNADAEIEDERYYFDSEGFFKRRIHVIDLLIKKQVGIISFNTWMNKATIQLNGERYHWLRPHYFSTKWEILDDNRQFMVKGKRYRSGQQKLSSRGEVLPILCGLVAMHVVVRSGGAH